MLVPYSVAAKYRNFGRYDAFPYKDWAYSYKARNLSEKYQKVSSKSQQRASNMPSKEEIRVI